MQREQGDYLEKTALVWIFWPIGGNQLCALMNLMLDKMV